LRLLPFPDPALKRRAIFGRPSGTSVILPTFPGAEQLAEKVVEGARSTPQALKRGHISNGLAARVNSCPSLFIEKSDFFRSL
jgi:hypothetical protein